MDKIIKNKRGLEPVASRSSGYSKKERDIKSYFSPFESEKCRKEGGKIIKKLNISRTKSIFLNF